MANSTSITKAITKLRRINGDHSSLSPLFYSSSAAASLPESLSASSLESVAEKENRSRWSKWLLFLPGAMSFGLGTWQIFRRQDKVELLEYRKKKLELEPLKLNQAFESSASLDFRRVLCNGAFDEGKSVFVGPRSRSISGVTENGYYVITPLVPYPSHPHSLQSAVLVNRGWVPRSWRDKSLQVQHENRHESNPESHEIQETETTSWWKFWSKKPQASQDQSPPTHSSSEIIGIVRGSENPSIFVPENEPRSGQWFYVDVPAIARACGLPEDTLYIEDINENVDPSNPYPIPKDVNTLIRFSVMPQDHLNYTLTWYSLSAAVTFMAFKRIRPPKIRR